MKKNKRLLSLCLGLVLVLGVSACDDLNDILGDLGSDDSDITTDLEEDDGDNNDDTSESNISYTYSVLITNEDELTPLVVEGDKVTAKVELVTTTHHIVTHDRDTSTVDATADDVVLQSSNAGVLEINGLTINPIGEGTTVLTAYWEEHDATSSGLEITVSEPDSYTYELEITNKDSYTDLTTESTLEDVSITLTTYKNGVVDGTPETGSSETVSLVSSDTSVITVESGSLSLTLVGAGDTIITAYWIGHEDEESAIDTIAITVSEPTSGGDEGGENPGGDTGGSGGSGEGGDTGGSGGSGEGGDTGTGGDDDEPGGGVPETVYISTLTFDKETYTLDMTTDTTATFTVTVNEDASDPNAYTVSSENESVATVSGNTITAVGVGETKIIAESTDNPGSPIYGCATVTVSKGYTVIESFSLNPTSITLEVGESASIGYAGGEQDPTVTVTYAPSDARNSAFTLTGGDEYLTIGERGENNTYTITASDTPDDAGSEVRTYTLTLNSEDEESEATASLSVTINDIEAKSHPVTDLTLSSYEKVIAHDGSFTVGPADSGADITASVNEGAYDSSINVTASGDGYLTVTGPDTNGVYTVTANVSDDNSVTSSVTVGTANASVSQTITVTIERAEAYAYAVTVNPSEVTMLTSETLTLGTDDNTLEVKVTNQYGEEVNDATWTAELTETSSEGVITSISYDTNTITINTGTVTGTGVITISVTDTELTATIAVTVNQQYYDIDTITYTGGDVSLTYNLGTEPVGSSTTISDEYVTYSSTQGPVEEGTEADFALYSTDETYISIEGKTITALLPTDEAVTVYIYLVGSSDVYTTISVTVTDITNYGVTSLSVTSTVTEIGAGETKTLEELGIEVTINPSYATDKSYTVESNSDVLAVTGSYGSYSLVASSGLREDVDVVLTFTSIDNSSATDTLSIKVTNDYVAVESVTLSASTLSLTYGGATGGSATITASVNPSNATDAGVITWNSTNTDAVTISGEGATATLTAVGTGTSEITATCGDKTSEACTVTVTEVFRSYMVVVRLLDSSGNTFPIVGADEPYGLWIQTEYDGVSGVNNGWGDEHLMTDNKDGTYSYKFENTPSAGSYGAVVYAGNEGGVSWGHSLDTFNIEVTGTEGGDYVMTTHEIRVSSDYQSWEDIFPAKGTEEETFYIVMFDNTSASDSTASTVTTITSSGSYFNGQASGSATYGSNSNAYGQYYVYNSTPGLAVSGTEDWFNFNFTSGGVSMPSNSTITIPEVSNGNVAICVLVFNSADLSSWYSAWVPSNVPNSITIDSNGWCTSFSSIDAFISAVTSSTTWIS